MSVEWEEIQQVKEDGRHELHLNGEVITERLEASNGNLPSSLFNLQSLNYLEISDTNLAVLSDDVQNLKQLINLALHRNKLTTVPHTINQLDKLKFLDISFNQLTSIPTSLCLPSLQTFNLSNNQLEELPDFTGYTCLNILFVEHNNLTSFPSGLNQLTGFTELNAANNQIKEITEGIHEMQILKNLDLSDNRLQHVIGELSECKKLKNLNLRNNPLKDNRLKKMTVQCSTKSILDYVAKQDSGSGKKKGKGKKGAAERKDEDDSMKRKIYILQNKDDDRRVVSTNSVKEERPYICCCVVKQLDLSDADIFKAFLSLQTKLHENECDMRTKATIATHSLDGLKFPLRYEAIPTGDIKIVALGKKGKSSASNLIITMKNERESLKLKKKRQVKTGLFKFLDLVDGKETLACLKNSDNEVISLPPITNSEVTKINPVVSDVFIEVTSPMSLPQCKFIMEELIKHMFQLQMSSMVDGMDGLVLEQLRVVDENGDLRVIYPSKIDLEFKGIPVERVENTEE